MERNHLELEAKMFMSSVGLKGLGWVHATVVDLVICRLGDGTPQALTPPNLHARVLATNSFDFVLFFFLQSG